MGGESKNKIMNSPVIQNLIAKDIEVMLFDEPMDEYVFSRIPTFDGKKLVNIGKGEFKLPQDDQERKRTKALKKAFSPLTEFWLSNKKSLFKSVEISQRVVTDPMVIVAAQNSDSANLERIFAA